MTNELFLEEQLRGRHERADPALDSLRTTAQVDVARAAARSLMRHHGELMRAGRGNEADEAAAEAEGMSDPARTPDVELELAARAAAIGSPDDAERRYRGLLAALGDESALGAVAAFRLAHLGIARGAREEAVALWERSLRGADENLRPHVLVELADSLRGRRRPDQVERLYVQAIETDHPDLAPQAALTLGGLREEAGDNKGALELYALVAASQHPEHASDAEARHGALIHGRTRRAIEQMLLFELKSGCDAVPDDESSARECANAPHADREPPHDLGHRRLSSYKRLLTGVLDHDRGLERTTAGRPFPDATQTDGGDRGLDCVVIVGNATAAASVGRGAHPDGTIAFVRVNGLSSYETAQDGLQTIADGMSGGGIGLGALANPSGDIETLKKLALCHFSPEQQSPWEGVLAASLKPYGQPHIPIDGRTIGLAFGDASGSSRDIGAMGPVSSDHLLLCHITYALTALHCKEALITGSLLGMTGSRWSDAMHRFDPGLARWHAVFEGPAAACRCESSSCGPGVGCLGQR